MNQPIIAVVAAAHPKFALVLVAGVLLGGQHAATVWAAQVVQGGVLPPDLLLQIAEEALHVPAVAPLRAGGSPQLLLFGGIFRNALGQIQPLAHVHGVQRVAQRIVEGPVGGDAQPGDDRFQRHALALGAAALGDEDLLQVIPAGGPALVQVVQEQVLLQHGHIVHAPLGKGSIRAAPAHKALQALPDGNATVQIGLGHTGDLGNVVLQFAEQAGLQIEAEGVQHTASFIHLHGADLNNLAPQGLFGPVVIKQAGLVADVPFQVKYDQAHQKGSFLSRPAARQAGAGNSMQGVSPAAICPGRGPHRPRRWNR